jgi:tetrahydromethanopterin S-methyltransferase subunit E
MKKIKGLGGGISCLTRGEIDRRSEECVREYMLNVCYYFVQF